MKVSVILSAIYNITQYILNIWLHFVKLQTIHLKPKPTAESRT